MLEGETWAESGKSQGAPSSVYQNLKLHQLTHAELEISCKKWSDRMSEHLQFCYAISPIWSDIIT